MMKIVCFFIISISSIFAQNISEIRLSDFLKKKIGAFSVTRYQSVLRKSGYSNWFSNSQLLILNEIKYDILPFNWNSVDLVPTDPMIIDNFYYDKFENSLIINNSKISDKFKLSFKTFMGSVTGDPAIHVFSRPDLSEEYKNKNKIIPAGVISLEDNYNNFEYRVTGGYYGYFSTGEGNDVVISQMNDYYYKKQNKQFLLNAEFIYKADNFGRLKINPMFMSYYGWDIVPFSLNFVHMENYVGSMGVYFTPVDKAYKLIFNYQNSVGVLHKGAILDPTKYSISKMLFSFNYSYEKDKIEYRFEPSVSFYSGKNYTDTKYSPFLKEEFTDIQFEIINRFTQQFTEEETLRLRLAGSGFNENFQLYGGAEYEYNISDNDIVKFNLNSEIKNPSYSELFGELELDENNKKLRTISGNRELERKRFNKFSINYLRKNTFGNFLWTLSIVPFYEKVIDPIDLVFAEEIDSTSNFVLVNAEYNNIENIAYTGIEINPEIKFRSLELKAYLSYLNNEDFLFIPKEEVGIELYYNFDFGGELLFHYKYEGKRDWQKFNLKSDEFQRFDIAYIQTINDLFFKNKIYVKLLIENIFDKKYKLFPLGNDFGRTIIFTLKGEI